MINLRSPHHSRPSTEEIEEPQSTIPTLDEVKQAQRITGELMWLLTRNRPDLMYAMSKMFKVP